jgi:signal recognition particle subunit SRP68
MFLKASGTDDNAGFPGSTRRHIVSRLNKAFKAAESLADLLSNKPVTGATDTDILEARAYAYSLSGAEEFEKHASGQRSADKESQREKWQECLVNYSTARVIYAALLKSTKKDMYKELLSGTVDPSIRFAAYQSHIPRTTAVVTISRKFFPEDQEDLVDSVTALDKSAFEDEKSASGETTGAASIPNTITWRGRKANIVDASIGQALATVSLAEEHLIDTLDEKEGDAAKDKAAAYDEVLIAAQDAADATRHAIEEHEKERIPEADPRMQDLRVTNLAVNYDLIGWRVGRNRVLIGEDDGAALAGPPPKKPKRPRKDGKEWVDKAEGNGRILARLRERVVLYDAILQSIDSVKELPGAVRDAEFVEELDGKRAYFRALKYVFLVRRE